MLNIEIIKDGGVILKSDDGKIVPSWALYLQFGSEYLGGVGITNNPDGTATYDNWTREENPPTNEELQSYRNYWTTECNLALLRKERDRLIAQTDYWMLSDTADVTQVQLDYRQALRDITQTYTSLDDVVWPVKP